MLTLRTNVGNKQQDLPAKVRSMLGEVIGRVWGSTQTEAVIVSGDGKGTGGSLPCPRESKDWQRESHLSLSSVRKRHKTVAVLLGSFSV